MSIPLSRVAFLKNSPEFAFSADGSKFAMAMGRGGVFVWDIRSIPLQTFTERPLPERSLQAPRFLQFSSGNLGKEILVFVEVRLTFRL